MAPIEQAIAAVLRPVAEPQPSADGLPHVTHSGVLELVPGLRMDVYRLSNGQAVVSEQGMKAFLEFMGLAA